ncbi:MAG: hypothetical protein PHQ98_02785, partial [Candidatus ainarchaeum sp.]|nr:hypothetical protein [Candidatus ainarchaeum sp.]
MDFEKLKKNIYDNRKILFILILIFFFAMAIRSNLIRYDGNYLFEPDAYYHARMIQQNVEFGTTISPDPLTYYEVAGGVAAQPWSIYWGISVILYKILEVVTLQPAFNKELFSFSVQFFPVVFGALISIAVYFLARDVFSSRKVGIISAFLAA